MKMFVAILTLASALNQAVATPAKADYNVVPQPKEVVLLRSEPFLLDASTKIVCPAELLPEARFLAAYVGESSAIGVQVEPEAAPRGAITLVTDPRITSSEGYEITILPDGITVVGGSAAGVFYAVQTLRKSLPVGNFDSVLMPAARITDYPRFGYRGMMLDVCRHFFDTDFVKRYIDILALHNLNTFHWHLSDDQGWRIEIKKYPRLTEFGSRRTETVIGRNSGRYDGKPYGEGCYYTQEQIREIVAYAAERHINVIPEIDMPGHMIAAIASYPELGCTGGPYAVWTQWGVSDDLLCVGKDGTLRFVEDVLDEVMALFPSEYIHIGGDECPKNRWKKCPACQARIDSEGLRNTSAASPEEALQGWFMRRVSDYLSSHGRKAIGWDEILDGGTVGGNTVVMSWRGEAGGIAAAKQRLPVIMAPNSVLYFDYYQTKDVDCEPFAIGGYNPIDKVYAYDPIARLPEKYRSFVVGTQANLWTEYILTEPHVEHMLLPRLAALSEVQWAAAGQKNYGAFLVRLKRLLSLYDRLGYNYAPYVLDVACVLHPSTAERRLSVELSTIDDAEIRYTLDGKQPSPRSHKYTAPVSVSRSCTLSAAAFRNGKAGRAVNVPIELSASALRPLRLLTSPAPNYSFDGAPTLNDGLRGNKNYRTGRWLGFYDTDCVAVIDFGRPTHLRKLRFDVCVNKDDGCMDARGVTVEGSDDGLTFRKITSEEYRAMTESDDHGVYNHSVGLASSEYRYIKVTIACEKNIPSWHSYAAGRPAFLFVDEIALD